MPSITLSQAQVAELKAFCAKHDLKQFYAAKDHGAYVGANVLVNGVNENVIFYFKKCDPQKDDDWYESAHRMFGGDDFGEHLPAEWLSMPDGATSLRITINKRSVKAEYFA